MDGFGSNAGESTVYSAGAGYDQASGLGSVDAAQLVNNWNAISFAATSTALQVTPATAVHGTNVTVSANVTPSSGSGTPTGAVSILTNSTSPSNESQTAVTLNNGIGSSSLNYLPGGTYQLTAKYSGDGVFAPSTSQPQTLTVMAESSTLSLKLAGGQDGISSALTYGVPVVLSAQPVGIHSPWVIRRCRNRQCGIYSRQHPGHSPAQCGWNSFLDRALARGGRSYCQRQLFW